MSDIATPIVKLDEVTAALEAYPQIRGIHDACNALPLPSGEDLQRLIQAIETTEWIEPALIDDQGLLVDGRSRILAASRLGLKVPIVVTSNDPWDIALANVSRRHLSKSQLAILALEMLPRYRAEAEARRRATLRKGREKGELTVPQSSRGSAASLVAKEFGISASLLEQALQLTDEQRCRVLAGEVSISAIRKEQANSAPPPRPSQPPRRGRKNRRISPFRIGYQSEVITVLVHRDTGRDAVITWDDQSDAWLVYLPHNIDWAMALTRDEAVTLAEKQVLEYLESEGCDVEGADGDESDVDESDADESESDDESDYESDYDCEESDADDDESDYDTEEYDVDDDESDYDSDDSDADEVR